LAPKFVRSFGQVALINCCSKALEKIGWEPSDAGESAWAAVATKDWFVAAREGSAAIEPLIMILRTHNDNKERIEAARALEQMRDMRAVQPIVGSLGNKDWQVRSGVMALTSLLEANLDRLEENDLRAVAAIDDQIIGIRFEYRTLCSLFTFGVEFPSLAVPGSMRIGKISAGVSGDHGSSVSGNAVFGNPRKGTRPGPRK